MSRECGDCTACCEGWLADADLGMHPGKTCPNLQGGRCAIYAERPEQPCRNFYCLWVKMPRLPEGLRPDRCGVIAWVVGEGDDTALMLSPIGSDVPSALIHCFSELVVPIRMPLIYESRLEKRGGFVGVNRFRLDAPTYDTPRPVSRERSS